MLLPVLQELLDLARKGGDPVRDQGHRLERGVLVVRDQVKERDLLDRLVLVKARHVLHRRDQLVRDVEHHVVQVLQRWLQLH